MADLNPLSAVNAALMGLVADTKGRSDNDTSDDLAKSGTNFTDVMMARVTARQNSSDELGDIQKDYASDGDKPQWVDQLQYAKAADKPADPAMARRPAERIAAVHDKAPATKNAVVKPSVTKDASKDAVLSDDAAVGAAVEEALAKEPSVAGLKKVASTLLEAEKAGKISLPDSVKSILEKIAAMDGSAAQIVPLMQNMLGALRKLELASSPDALKQAAGDMTWPAEITNLFKDLQVNPGIKTDQPVDLGKIIKALRTLGNLVQNAAEASKDAETQTIGTLVLPSVPKKSEAKSEISVDGAAEAALKKDDLSDKAVVDAMIAASASAPVTAATTPVKSADIKADGFAKPSGLVASPAGADRSGGEPILDKTPKFDKAAAPVGSTGKDGAVPAAQSFQVEAPEPVALNPMAAALSARTVLTAAAVTPAGQILSNVPHPATQQVVVALQKSPITKETSLSLQLNPAELGRVDVKITIDQNGKAVAQVMADRPETLALLQKDSSHLEKALQNAGLNSSAQDLHYSLREQNKQNGQEFSSRKRRNLFDTDDDIKNVSLDPALANIMSGDGLLHKVNYHA